MKDKTFLIVAAGIIIVLSILCAVFVLNTYNLKNKVAQSNSIIGKIESELGRVREEKEEIARKSEKLSSDAVSYLAINTKLAEEKDQLNKKLEGAQKIIEAKEADLQRSQQRLKDIEKEAVTAKKAKDDKLAREKRSLEKKIIATSAAIKKERALYHYNLGVAYAQAKLYDEAIEEYEKSLEFDSDNADAHYNLGILYETITSDAERAMSHYKKYLEINPRAEDIDEVAGRINRLSK
ncbi:MAG: tetratricopeptide repeat protein [Candidatus Omnitrophota bacterium]|nr:tetratricopeptide repeat protein [Candidatus Omnitrophota bacterium]